MKNSWKIVLLALICFVLGTSEYVVVGVLDTIASSVNITIAQAGQLISVFAITASIGTPVAIYFLSGISQRKILMIALFIITVSCVMMCLTYTYPLLIISRIIMALGVGVFNVYCFIAASKLAPKEKRTSAIATITVGYNAALIVGLPIGRVVTSLFGWHSIFWFTAIFSIAAIFLLYKTIPDYSDDKPTGIMDQMRFFKRPRLVVSFLVSFFWIMGYAILYSYITPYLKNTSGMGEKVLSMALFAFGIATLIGNKSGAFLGERLGIPKTLISSMFVHMLALVLISLVNGSVYGTILILMLWAISAWLPGPLLRFNVIDLAPESPQVILSLYNSIVQLGFALGAGLGGLEFENLPTVMLSWSAAVSVTVALFFALVYNYGSLILQPIRKR